MLRSRARTETVDRTQIDIMVEKYTCVDSSYLGSVGKANKILNWQVRVLGLDTVLDIVVHIDKTVARTPTVQIEANKNKIFPAGGLDRTKLREDFRHFWKFRGAVRGLNDRGIFEVNIYNQWYPAILTQQRADGDFEAVAQVPDNSRSAGLTSPGWKEQLYPAISASNIRYAQTRQPLISPVRYLHLIVPAEDPSNTGLYVSAREDVGAGGHGVTAGEAEGITHLLGRVTPVPPAAGLFRQATNLFYQSKQAANMPMNNAAPRITASVNKDRTIVSFDCPHTKLQHFLNNEVRSVTQSNPGQNWVLANLSKWWDIQIGPVATHRILVEKQSRQSAIVTLKVDDEVLAQALSADIETGEPPSGGAWWFAEFTFVGEKFLDFEVHESDANGYATESKSKVSIPSRYKVKARVSVPSDSDFNNARLEIFSEQTGIGGHYVDFSRMPLKVEPRVGDPNVSGSPDALKAQYNMLVPYKVTANAQDGTGSAGMQQVLQGVPGAEKCVVM